MFLILLLLAKRRVLNKRKIINDPVYGFISISSDLLFDLVNFFYGAVPVHRQNLARKLAPSGFTFFVVVGGLE